MRFINNCKDKVNKCSGPLTYDELTKAKVKMIHCVQREAYPKGNLNLEKNKKIPK